MRRLVGQYLLTIISLVAAAITIYQYKVSQFDAAQQNEKISILFLGGLASFFLIESLYYRIRWGRESRYARVLENVNKAFTTVHYLDMVNESVAKINNEMMVFCSNCAFAFSFITGSKCAVAVKIITMIENDGTKDFATQTLFRDGESNAKRKQTNDGTVHWISQNTDFSVIMEHFRDPARRHFLSNRLPFIDFYQNTSFKDYGNPQTSDVRFFNKLVRNRTWPLPYKSTLVVPICPMNSKLKTDIIGFLCVDSSDRGVFKKRFDLDLLIGIADGMAPKIKQLQDNQNRFGGTR